MVWFGGSGVSSPAGPDRALPPPARLGGGALTFGSVESQVPTNLTSLCSASSVRLKQFSPWKVEASLMGTAPRPSMMRVTSNDMQISPVAGSTVVWTLL